MNRSNRLFLDRLYAQLDPTNQSDTRSDAAWIAENTFLNSVKFSFAHHEYQLEILNSKAQVKFVRKCSQIGISEISVRRAVAKCMRFPGTNTMYVLPTAAFASTFSATRLQPTLDSCPQAKDSLHKTDAATVKRFANESFIYMKGASRAGQAISVPVDFLVIDEKDFAEDQAILSSFASRLTHSAHKDELHFSTPTVNGYGISYDFENSLQHWEITTCNHCNHKFIPDYHKHVKLPGFNVQPKPRQTQPQAINSQAPAIFPDGLPSKFERDLHEIGFLTKSILNESTAIREAMDPRTTIQIHKNLLPLHHGPYIQCPNPKCQRPVSQAPQYREFVQKNYNPDTASSPQQNAGNHQEHGYQITPFSVPGYLDPLTNIVRGVPPVEMIRLSTRYVEQRDFINNCLGLPFEDASTGLSIEEIHAMFRSSQLRTPGQVSADALATGYSGPTYPDYSPPYQISGTDLGGTCANITAYPAPDGHVRITSLKRIPLHQLTQVFHVNNSKNRVISSVADALPYTDTVLALQSRDPRLFASLFSSAKDLELYRIKDQEPDPEKATYGLKQISVKRDAMLDMVMNMIRNRQISVVPSPENMAELDIFTQHLRDSKRIKIGTTDGGKGVFTWRKSPQGVDHYFLALGYLILANYLKDLSSFTDVQLPLLVTKIKVDTPV